MVLAFCVEGGGRRQKVLELSIECFPYAPSQPSVPHISQFGAFVAQFFQRIKLLFSLWGSHLVVWDNGEGPWFCPLPLLHLSG